MCRRFVFVISFCFFWSDFGLAQSFAGAELGSDYGNAEAEDGLDGSTPSNDVDEITDYGNYDSPVGDYGLGGAGASASDYGNYSAGGQDADIFDSAYDDYETPAPKSGATAAPVSNFSATGTNTYAPAVESVPNTQAVPVEPVATTPLEPVAPVDTYAVPSSPNLVQDPIAAEEAPAAADVDAQTYYPTEEASPVPDAMPLPPPNEFSGAPPVPGTMRIMADGEAPEEYQVEPGDTLFDICDQLLDEPAYWPKLWALNPEIKNPHFIYPGMTLRFYPGDEESPPYLQVVAEEDIIPIDKGDLDESQLILEPIQFVTEEFEEVVSSEVVGPDQVLASDDVLVSGGSYTVPAIEMRIPGFIFGEEKAALGRVHMGRQGETGAHVGSRVFFEKDGGLSEGGRYSVLRYGREVENPKTGDFVGHLYYWVCNVDVDRALEDPYVSGVVTEGRLSARPGDILVDFLSTNRQTTADYQFGSLASVDASVVGFGEELSELGAQGQFAFLDVGSSGGVSPGMYVPIYGTARSYSMRTVELDLPTDYQQVGVVRVLDATPSGAVGLIVQSYDVVRIGDRTGKG